MSAFLAQDHTQVLGIIDQIVGVVAAASQMGPVEDVCALLIAAGGALETLARRGGRDFDAGYMENQILETQGPLVDLLGMRL